MANDPSVNITSNEAKEAIAKFNEITNVVNTTVARNIKTHQLKPKPSRTDGNYNPAIYALSRGINFLTSEIQKTKTTTEDEMTALKILIEKRETYKSKRAFLIAEKRSKSAGDLTKLIEALDKI